MKFRLPRKRRYRFLLYFFSISLVLLAIDLIIVRVGRQITIATDTTRVTSPLTSDGRIDYLAALNTRAGEGPPPDQNAAITFLSIFGSTLFNDRFDHAVYNRLHLPLPDPAEKFYTRYGNFLSSHAPTLTQQETYARLEQFDSLHLHLWTPAADPFAAQFLDTNARFLDLSAQTLTQSGYYFPLIVQANDQTLISVLLPTLGHVRELTNALAARAALRAAAGNFDGARADLQITSHLAALMNRQPFVIQSLVAAAIHETASATLQAIATESSFSADQLKILRADLESLPPISFIDSFDAERLFTLDFLQFAARVGPLTASPRIRPPDDLSRVERIREALTPFIPGSFNQALRDTNTYYDNLLAAARLPTFRDRVAQASVIDQQVKNAYSNLHFFSSPAQHIRLTLLPALSHAMQRVDRTTMTRDLTRVALALAAYHADHQTYPTALAELAPTYLSAIPEDLFINAPLHYTPSSNGYLLYSVGMNMLDDHAHNRDNKDPSNPTADDLIIRTGPPPATAPITSAH